jgi:uncharacterized membrane protein
MTLLIASCIAFLALHMGISSTPLRGMLNNVLGQRGYLALYSLLAFAALGAMIYSYGSLEHAQFVWHPDPISYKVTKVLVFFAIVLLVMGTMVKNPTAVMMEDSVNQDVAGILKITRHPTQWAILLFSIGHLIANGDKASIVFFGTLAVMSGAGMLAMDSRKKANQDEEWLAFHANTSVLPFAALISGRAKLKLSELNWIAVVIGVALYSSAYWLHDMVSGGTSLF